MRTHSFKRDVMLLIELMCIPWYTLYKFIISKLEFSFNCKLKPYKNILLLKVIKSAATTLFFKTNRL